MQRSTMPAFIVLILLTAGCADRTQTAQLFAQWSVPIEDAGLVLISPPVEDLKIGDIFVDVLPPEQRHADVDGTAQMTTAGRVASLPVLEKILDEYRARPAFPRTPSIFMGSVDAETREMIEARKDGTLFEVADGVDRLPLVSFGGITATLIEPRNFAGSLLPTEAVTLTFGDAFLEGRAITISISAAESYGLPEDIILAQLFEPREDGTPGALRPEFRRFLPLYAGPEATTLWVRVVTGVVYMRSLDYSIYPAPTDDVEDIPPPDLTRVLPPPDEGPTPGIDPLMEPFERATRINQRLAMSGVEFAPGSRVQFISVAEDVVTMRRTWQRGLAIAARTREFPIDPETGELARPAEPARASRP